MLESITATSGITPSSFLICIACAIGFGILTSLLGRFKNHCSQSFLITLALLPPVVGAVIMLVNGSVGAGVAAAGAFSLVRFRSVPGSAREIGLIFMAMAIGLICGMGYIVIAALFFLLSASLLLILTCTGFGAPKFDERILKITIPENLDYDGLFDSVFAKYLRSYSLIRIKTVNLGTLYELDYEIILKGTDVPKAFLDELRLKNGNLNIICSRVAQDEAL